MEKKLDLRIQKTHMALMNSFIDLLEEKPFENITVNELCDRAMIRRATFYKHFGDKYEFFTYMIHELMHQFDVSIPMQFHSERPKEYFIDFLRYILDFLDENEKIINSLLKSRIHAEMLYIISEEILSGFQKQLKKDKQQGIPLPVDPELMAQVFTGSLLFISKWWIGHKNRISKNDLIQQLSDWIFHDNISTALRK